MTKELHIARGVVFSSDGVTEKLAFLGRTGSGKTYSAMKVCEEMLKINAQVIALDPIGKWHGLRTLKNGKKGFPIPVFGGLYGDIPLLPESGKLIADLIVDKHISAILDVSQFESDAQKTKFSTDFSARFYFRKKSQPSPVHIFLEESQEFIPQNPQKGEEVMLHNFQRIWKLGRNYGIGGSLISQRPQEINKKALNQSECIFAFQMTGPHEKKAVKEWVVNEKGLNEQVENLLPHLKQGECWLWSPAWLNISKRIKVNEKDTIDISATPKVGGKIIKPQELSSSEIKKITEAMAETIDKAKENHPAELKKEILKLRKELKQTSNQNVPIPTAYKGNSVKMMGQKQEIYETQIKDLKWKLADVESKLRKYDGNTNTILKNMKNVLGQSQGISYKLETEIKALEENAKTLSKKSISIQNKIIPVSKETNGQQKFINSSPYVHEVVKPSRSSEDYSSLGKCDRGLLTVLAQREGKPSTKSQVALLSGYSVKSSGFVNGLSRLRVAGLLNGGGESMIITEKGKLELGEFEKLPEGEDLHKYWINKLSKADGTILKLLIYHYPDYITRENISNEAGYSIRSSGFVNALSRLRTMELIEENSDKEAKASDYLFN